jgi:hypothetical protein
MALATSSNTVKKRYAGLVAFLFDAYAGLVACLFDATALKRDSLYKDSYC